MDACLLYGNMSWKTTSTGLILPYCAAIPLILSAAASRDRDVLVALYWATDGDNWRNSDNWLTEAPISMWHGVTTDKNGRVIELDLWGNNLSGTIPSRTWATSPSWYQR